MRVMKRTPKGQPDKEVSFWQLIASFVGIISLGGTLFNFVMDAKISSRDDATREILRAETNAKVEKLREYVDNQIIEIRKNTWPQFYTKAEIDERRKELDRRYDESKDAMRAIQDAIMELKLHDAQEHRTR